MPPPMAPASRRTSRRPAWRRWFSHKRLVLIEALLLLGPAKSWAEAWILARPELANAAKLAIAMLMHLGVFATIFILVERWLAASVARTHAAVQALPIPTPLLAMHLLALAGLVWLWSVMLELPLL